MNAFFAFFTLLIFTTTSYSLYLRPQPCSEIEIEQAIQAGSLFVSSSLHTTLPNYSQTLSPSAYFGLHRCMREIDTSRFISLSASNFAMVIISTNSLIHRVHTQSSMWGKDAKEAGAHVYYFLEKPDETLGNLITVLDDEGAKGLTKVGADHRSLRGLQYVLRTLDDINLQWIYMADDDTYYEIRELVALVRPFRSEIPVIISHQFRGRMRWTGTYDSHSSGGAGMLISISAARLLAAALYTDKCTYQRANDVTISHCSRKLKIPQVHFHSMQPDWDGFSAMPAHALSSYSELGGAVSAHRLVPTEWFTSALNNLNRFFKPKTPLIDKLCFDLRSGQCNERKKE
jgi:hypothetical protein